MRRDSFGGNRRNSTLKPPNPPPRKSQPLGKTSLEIDLDNMSPEIKDMVEKLLDQLQQTMHEKLCVSVCTDKNCEQKPEDGAAVHHHGTSDGKVALKMHNFFIKKFLDKNVKKELLQSEIILQKILALQRRKDWKEKEKLYDQYWIERKKEQDKLNPSGQFDVNQLLKNICKNFDKDKEAQERELIEAEQAEYEQDRQVLLKSAIKILNTNKFEDVVNQIVTNYKKHQ